MILATRQVLTEVVVFAAARPNPDELIDLGIKGPCEIRGDQVDGRQRWVITSPPPTGPTSQARDWERVDIAGTVALEVAAAFADARLTRFVAATDQQELVATIAERVARRFTPDQRIAAAVAELGAEHQPAPDWQAAVWTRIAVETAELLVAEELRAFTAYGDSFIADVAKSVGTKLARRLGGAR